MLLVVFDEELIIQCFNERKKKNSCKMYCLISIQSLNLHTEGNWEKDPSTGVKKKHMFYLVLMVDQFLYSRLTELDQEYEMLIWEENILNTYTAFKFYHVFQICDN